MIAHAQELGEGKKATLNREDCVIGCVSCYGGGRTGIVADVTGVVRSPFGNNCGIQDGFQNLRGGTAAIAATAQATGRPKNTNIGVV